MKKQFVMWGVILLTIVNIASLSTIGYYRFIHDHADDRRENRRENRRESFYQELGLSERQINQMDELRRTMDSNINPLRGEIRTKREQFYQFINAPDPDRVQIDRVSNQIDSLQTAIKGHVIDHMLAQREIFTPEQHEEFVSIMRKRYGNGSRRR